MLCAECESVLSDYIDNDVAESVRRKVEAHMAACARCETLHDDLARLIQASATLPLHTPSSQLWSRIEREVSRQPETVVPFFSRRFDFSVSARQMTAAAALVLSMGFLGAFTMRPTGSVAQQAANWDSVNPNVATIQAGPLAHRLDDFRSLELSVAAAERDVTARQGTWTPELRGAFETGLGDVNGRIEAAQEACRRTPDDAACRARLVGLYREKLALFEGYAVLGK